MLGQKGKVQVEEGGSRKDAASFGPGINHVSRLTQLGGLFSGDLGHQQVISQYFQKIAPCVPEEPCASAVVYSHLLLLSSRCF